MGVGAIASEGKKSGQLLSASIWDEQSPWLISCFAGNILARACAARAAPALLALASEEAARRSAQAE